MANRYTYVKASFDWVLFSVYLALVVIGLLMLYATGADFGKEIEFSFLNTDIGRQCIWAGISVSVCIVLSFIDWKIWNTLAYPLFGLTLFLLVAVLIFGSEIKGAKSWFSFFGFSIQPSEFAKISTILVLSSYCSTFKTNLINFRDQTVAFMIMLLPAGLIMLQPDAGSALTFIAFTAILYRNGLPNYYFIIFIGLLIGVVLSIVYSPFIGLSVILTMSLFFILNFSNRNILSYLIPIAFVLGIFVGVKFDFIKITAGVLALTVIGLIQFNAGQSFMKKQLGMFAIIGFIGLMCFGVSHTYENILKPHQQDRINVWLKPQDSDPQGSLYNLIQSKRAIGAGGINGKGFLKGTMTKLNYVPEQNTDFIFTTVGEEQGFIGCLGLIILFFILLFKAINIGERASIPFPLYFSYGVAGLIFLHVFINIGMTIGVTPVIGIPLPFISKGGSSMLAFSILIGILLNISKQVK